MDIEKDIAWCKTQIEIISIRANVAKVTEDFEIKDALNMLVNLGEIAVKQQQIIDKLYTDKR